MTQPRDPDTIIATWLDNGPIKLPEETRRAISVGLRTQPRARRLAILGGSSMIPFNRFVAAAAVLLAGGALSAFVLANRAGGPAAAPTPLVPSAALPTTSPRSQPPSIAPSPSSISTAGWISFTSSRYGYSIALPPFWPANQSTRAWSFALDQQSFLTTAADSFGTDPRVTAFAADIAAGKTGDQWIAEYHGPDAKGSPDPCRHVPVALETAQVDGHRAVFWNDVVAGDCEGTSAFVFIGNRVHVFTIGRAGQEQLLEALMSTVTFRE